MYRGISYSDDEFISLYEEVKHTLIHNIEAAAKMIDVGVDVPVYSFDIEQRSESGVLYNDLFTVTQPIKRLGLATLHLIGNFETAKFEKLFFYIKGPKKIVYIVRTQKGIVPINQEPVEQDEDCYVDARNYPEYAPENVKYGHKRTYSVYSESDYVLENRAQRKTYDARPYQTPSLPVQQPLPLTYPPRGDPAVTELFARAYANFLNQQRPPNNK